MKKLLLIILLTFSASTLFSEEVNLMKSKGKSNNKVNLEQLEGKAKLGVSLGYPTGITFGYQMTKLMELNTTLALFDFDSIAAGISALFALLDLEAGDIELPVSAGPAVYFHSGGNTKIDILGVLRLEYDFDDAPVNIFLEGGMGIRVTPETKLIGSGALGIRYIF